MTGKVLFKKHGEEPACFSKRLTNECVTQIKARRSREMARQSDDRPFRFADGTRLCVYAFVMILSYSRMCGVAFTLSMRQELLIGAHQRAFAGALASGSLNP